MPGMAAMPHAAGRPVLSSVANNLAAGAARAMHGSALHAAAHRANSGCAARIGFFASLIV
jgi:hypothetical protein